MQESVQELCNLLSFGCGDVRELVHVAGVSLAVVLILLDLIKVGVAWSRKLVFSQCR